MTPPDNDRPTPTAVPDDGIPPELAAIPDLWDDEGTYGGEASVPFDHDGYTGSLRSVMPETRTMTPQLRELDRRLRDRLTPAFPLERLRRLPGEFLWRRYRELAMRGRSAVVDPYGRDPVLADRLDPLLDFLYTRYFRVEASGVQHLPQRGPAILVANHAGPLPWDSLVLVQGVLREHRRELRPLLEDAIFQVPYLGVLLNRLGAVRASPENAERLLSEGKLVAVFPEGQQGLTKLYKDRHTLKRFGRGGFVKLALRTGVPLIPVAVVGAEGAAPVLGKIGLLGRSIGLDALPITATFPWLGPAGLLPLPSKWRLRFGEPIDVAKSHGADAADDRILIARLADQVRSRVQEIIGELVSDKGADRSR
jgi:1-acyl-sn-glycerol-3-phosphate acyltransferase